MERLYQPDFQCIFGPKYANAFSYDQVDSLVWPILNEIKPSQSLERLLQFKNVEGRPYFYHRRIDLNDLKIELNCSGIDHAFIQAMDLNRSYGIANSDVVNIVKLDQKLFSGVISYTLNQKNIVENIINIQKEIPIVGIVLYPSLAKFDLNDSNNQELSSLISFCAKSSLFLKIDVGNTYLPDNDSKFTSNEVIKKFTSDHQEIPIILSGLDVNGDFTLYYQLLKYFNNLWLEIEPRSFGGTTPKDNLLKIFSIGGFIQNSWNRISFGSATPTLESSQIKRGFLEATEELPFAQKLLLRTWSFRNIVRLNSTIFKPKENMNSFSPLIAFDLKSSYENESEFDMIYDIHLRSYAVTQLIFITDMIKIILNEAKKTYPSIKNGDLLIRSYHTTTSLIINEHEYGNYLDLHYKFAEISKLDSSKYLHTVRALENRADFNHYDHELASTYGMRNLIIPILEGELEIGSRENFYVLVTFGPRSFHLLVKLRIIKDAKATKFD
jgi:thiamine phosphate synthase YjbQ (UPF0047 family)